MRQRLAAGFALLLGVFVALFAAISSWHGHSAAAERAFAEKIVPLRQGAQDLERALLYTGLSLRAYLLRPEDDVLARFEARLAGARAALERLSAMQKPAASGELFGQAAPLVSSYLRIAAETAARQGYDPSQAASLEQSLSEPRDAAMHALEAFSARQEERAREALDQIEQARRSAALGIAVAAAAGLLLFGGVALLVARSIQRPTKELVTVAGALQAGDWKPALAWAPGAAQPTPRDEMRRLAQAFGAAAASLEQREQRMRAHRAVAEATGASLDKGEIAAAALRAISEHLSAEIGAFYSYDGDVLHPVALRAPGGTLAPLALGEGIPGRAAQERRRVVVREIPVDSAFSVRLGYDAAPPKIVAAAPVVFRGRLLGVLLVGSLRSLDEDALSFLDSAASRLAVGLENVRAYQEIRELAAELEEKSGLLQDQNEELQAQSEEIQAQNEELQAQGEEIHAQNDQLKLQTEQLQAYAASLAEADRRKDEFLGVLAHELRNPMAAITNSLHTLANSPRPEHRARAEQVIARQTRLLTRLVDDLLDVTRIARGKIKLQTERLELAALIRECADDYRDVADKAAVALVLELEEAVVIDGDRARLCQIVGNLLDNAIKFSRSEGRVLVSLAAGLEGAEIRVRDEGSGIDANMLARLFQPFSQADASLARRKGGLGLGLALTKALVELHGGAVQAKSEGTGRGAEFVVCLPLSQAREGAARAEVRQPACVQRPRRRLLIVEDNADAGLTLKDAMELDGHDVRIACDAGEALALAREFLPEVVLCDIGLPTLDGYELVRRMRADERFQSTFMIAVTGYAGPEDQRRASQAGFDRHFGKPADLERLRELLAEHAPAQQRAVL